MTTATEHQACENTDRELWREREGDYYADSIHVTKGGGIGINCGGTVFVKPIRQWHRLAQSATGRCRADAAVMSVKYRIYQNGVNSFGIQQRVLWFFWVPVNERWYRSVDDARKDIAAWAADEAVRGTVYEVGNSERRSTASDGPEPSHDECPYLNDEGHARHRCPHCSIE